MCLHRRDTVEKAGTHIRSRWVVVWQLYGSPARLRDAFGKVIRLWPEVGFRGVVRLAASKLARPNLPVDRLREGRSLRVGFEDRPPVGVEALWEGHSVSVIILTRGSHALIERCLASMMRSISTEANVSFLISSNAGAVTAPADFPFPVRSRMSAARFNWAAFNNQAAVDSDGEFLLFLNDDVEAIHPGWLEALIEEALQPDAGAVGAKLLYPDGTIQHYGISVRWDGKHSFDAKYQDRHAVDNRDARRVDAVTGACLLTPRKAFLSLGGFDQSFALDQSDVDYCLRLGRMGMRVVVTPRAELIHLETTTRPPRTLTRETRLFVRKWGTEKARGLAVASQAHRRRGDACCARPVTRSTFPAGRGTRRDDSGPGCPEGVLLG